MSIIDDVLAEARRRAEQVLGVVIEQVPGFQNLKELLEEVEGVEREMLDLYIQTKRLDSSGIARVTDFYAYNTMRMNMSRAQNALLRATRQLFASRPDVLRELPVRVILAPALYPGGVAGSLPSLPGFSSGGETAPPTEPSGGVRGLGNLGTPVAAAPAGAAFGLAPWMICAIILAAIVALGVAAFAAASSIGVISETVSQVLVVRQQVRAFRAMVDARLRIYEDCRASGQPPAECARLAGATVPTPKESTHDYKPPGGWIKWMVVGIIGAGVLGIGYWIFRERMKGAKVPQLQGANPRYRPVRAERFPDEPAGDAGLPV